MDDIYDVAYLRQNGFPSNLISLNMVPPGLFLGNIETVDLDKKLIPPISNAMTEEARKVLEKHSGKQLLVVKRDRTQNFSNMKISKIYSSFRLSDRLSLALEDCLRFILDIPSGKPLVAQGGGDPFGSLIFLHARVERDWESWAHNKLPRIEYYTSTSEIKRKMQESTNAILNITATASPTLIVSYGVGNLIKGDTLDIMKNGWPEEFRVVTCDNLEIVLKKYTYLEKSVILSQIASRSNVFIGNSHSSFSLIIGKARHERVFWYNTKKTNGFTDVK